MVIDKGAFQELNSIQHQRLIFPGVRSKSSLRMTYGLLISVFSIRYRPDRIVMINFEPDPWLGEDILTLSRLCTKGPYSGIPFANASWVYC